MSGFGLNMRPGRLRRPTAAVPDPATFSPSGYWENRGGGSASDYTLANGVWANRKSGGGNAWIGTASPNQPPLGALVDGCAPIEIHNSATKKFDILDARGTPLLTSGVTPTFAQGIAGTDWSCSFLCKIPSGLALGAVVYNGAGLFGDLVNQQYWYIGCGDDTGVTYVAIGGYITAGGSTGVVVVRTPVPAGQWCQVNIRHTAGLLAINTNAAPGTVIDGVNVKAADVQVNPGYAMTTHSTGTPSPGASFLSLWTKPLASDADYTGLRAWWRGPQYPSLAGVLPA